MKNDLYPEAYGKWSGMPDGVKPDYERCCVEVSSSAWAFHQCGRKRGYGPDEAYCKQHDPAAVAKRLEDAAKRERERHRKRGLEYYGPSFYKALKLIAEGHNDPRALAQKIISDFDKGHS